MKNFQILTVILIFILAIGCTPQLPVVLPEAVKTEVPTIKKVETGISEERLARFDAFLAKEIEEGKVPGAVTFIKRKGETVHRKAFGVKSPTDDSPMGLDEIFYIQSMTKPIVSVAFMMLYEEGHFQLNDPVSKYLPAFKEMKVATDHSKDNRELVEADKPITIAHALSHTAGLSHGLGQTDLEKQYMAALYLTEHKNIEDRVKALANMPLVGQPGGQWYYSASPDILAALIEQFSGMTCADFLQKRIFDPLGMKDTGYNMKPNTEHRKAFLYGRQPDGSLVPAPNQTPATGHTIYGGTHGLFSTASDYMKFSEMLLNSGKANGEVFLSRKTIELMTSNCLQEGQSSGRGQGFGLGFGTNEDLATSGVLGTEGSFYWSGAFNTYFFVDPKEELVGILMMQTWPYTNYYSDKLRQFTYQAIVD